MSLSEHQLFETALSLSQAERADLAFQLLQSLTPPGEEMSSSELAAEIQGRVAAHRRGDIKSFSRDETRAIVIERLTEDG
jgi:putative addiction module component (TIGR02574 family)